MEKFRRCAVLGQAPLSFTWGYDEEAEECRRMKLELAQQIMALRQSGVTSFWVACDPGIGLYAAEIVNILRESSQELQLFCISPHEEQATKWTPQLRERYFEMLEKCTYVRFIAPHELPDAQLAAYKKIIDSADILLAVCDPNRRGKSNVDKAIVYARDRKLPIIFIHPDTLEVELRNIPCQK